MTTPHGSWPSPLSAADLAVAGTKIDGARYAAGGIWWSESVPQERGRMRVMRRDGVGAAREVLRAPWSARSRVHEYGGGAWTVADDGTLLFVDGEDQRVHRLDPETDAPVPLTAPGPRYGGLRAQQGRLFAVREDLRAAPHQRAIVEIPLDGSAAADDAAVTTILGGDGFFAHPVLSPDGTRLALVTWDVRRMPWEASEALVVDLATGSRTPMPGRAALQPEWLSDDELLFSHDATGRWNLYRAMPGGAPATVSPADADTGGGLWVLGQRWFRVLEDGRILAVRTNGSDALVLIERDGTERELAVPFDGDLSLEDAHGSLVLITGQGRRVTPGLWELDLDAGVARAIRGGDPVDPAWVPGARPVSFDGPHGPVHAFDHAPANPDADAAPQALPPYVVQVHGGPTAHSSGAQAGWITYFTSRGIGVLEVNYGGSTGYGRAYRERLDGEWGIVDVDDVLAAAQGLADAGLADPARIAIRGGSAGGWTVLSALVRGGMFAAGLDRYGVVDLRLLAEETHDFERYYLDGLVGTLPEAEQTYIDRSPLTHADRIDVPVLILQGADDAVVPPSQSEAIRDALAARGVPHEYVLFPGEGHGFRQADTIIAAAEAELRFLGSAFGFDPVP
ncbi:prolyl oligopeptidase family serine peptidase [Microbacterium sp. MYb64]|uniref:S9 family peptidase n=1 Tax=Microbacterium sp. MYb64 TaxID=1848691 RepID=UPI000CFCBE62|nr:prolyl oligopeptidase family serine peptidase [Microbacterium sp. MYb64]PRB02306.1 S9 family peptidase [Microbacterium sp. MYb64]